MLGRQKQRVHRSQKEVFGRSPQEGKPREGRGALWGKDSLPIGWVGPQRRGNPPPQGKRMDGRTPRLLPALEVSGLHP